MLNPLLYDENDNYNPTEFLTELLCDIRDLPIRQVFKKYEGMLSSHEIAGYLTQEVTVHSSRQAIQFRVSKRNE